MTAAVSATPATPAPSSNVTATVTGASDLRSRWTLDGVQVGPTVCDVSSGTASIVITVSAATGSQTIAFEQYVAGTWTLADDTTVTVTAGGGTPPPVGTLVGFGNAVTGGDGYPIVWVTNLNNSGTGSLRSVMGSNRVIVPAPGLSGDLVLSGDEVGGSGMSNFTIDFSGATGNITIKGWGLEFSGCSNFILRQIAIRDTDAVQFQSSLTLRNGCHDFYLDHISADGYSHRGIDIYNSAYDWTVAYPLVGPKGSTGLSNFPFLAGKIIDRGSLDHPFFINGETRMPQADYDNQDGAGPTPSGVTLDIANGLFWSTDASYFSLLTAHGQAKVNVRNTFFYGPVATGANHAIHTETGAFVYQTGCTGKGGTSLTTTNSAGSPYSVAAAAVLPLEATATAAGLACKAGSGRTLPSRDATDTAYAALVTVP